MGKSRNTFAIFLLAVGCVSTISKITVCAALLLLIDYFMDREQYHIRELFAEKIVINSCKVIGLAIGFFMVAAIVNCNIAGIKEAGHYFERIIPFFLVSILIYKRENILLPLMLGACCGVLIVGATVLNSYIFEGMARPSGILGQPNKLGGWAILILPFIAACTYYYRNKLSTKILGGAVSVLVVIVLFLSASRGAIVGLAVMGLIGVLIFFRLKIKYIFTIILIFSVVSIGAYQLDVVGFQRSYDNERILLWDSGVEMFFDHPLVGVGWNNWGVTYREDYISPLAKEPRLVSPHNFILHYLDTVGIVGTSGIIFLFLSQIYCVVNNLYDQNTLEPVVFSMLLCTIGMLVHGMVDVIFMNRFFMVLYSFLWGITCYYIMVMKKYFRDGNGR